MGIDDAVDSASSDATFLIFDPELAGRTTTAVLSVVGESGFADTLARSVSLAVGLAGDACHANAVYHVVSSVADASSSAVAVAVGGADSLDAFVSLSLVSRVADASISNLLTVFRANVGVDVEDTQPDRVAGVTWRTYTDLAVVDFVVA